MKVLTDLASAKGLYSSNPGGAACRTWVTDGSWKSHENSKIDVNWRRKALNNVFSPWTAAEISTVRVKWLTSVKTLHYSVGSKPNSPHYSKCNRPIIQYWQRRDDSNNFHGKTSINSFRRGGNASGCYDRNKKRRLCVFLVVLRSAQWLQTQLSDPLEHIPDCKRSKCKDTPSTQRPLDV